MASIWEELKRRNVVKVAVAYAIVGWLLIEVASTLLPTFDAPAWVQRVIVLLVGMGFVLALVLSWAYELTAQGVVSDDHAQSPAGASDAPRKKLDFVIVGLLALGIAFLVLDNYVVDHPDEEAARETTSSVAVDAATQKPPSDEADGVLKNSVAVLPFENLSSDPENAYFAAGIHEETLNELTKLSSLSIISRTSMLRYANSELSIPEIARELNVETVLEGSVRYAANRVRITAQLIDARTDEHLWSEVYERDFADIFAIQSDIAMNIANALQAEFSLEEQASLERAATSSPEAYALYLQALSVPAGNAAPAANSAMVLDLLNQALEFDPEFALAYVRIARQMLVFGEMVARGPAQSRALARENAERALALDPALGSAYGILAITHMQDWDGAGAQQAFDRALQLSPNDPEVLRRYATFNAYIGNYDYAIGLGTRAFALQERANGLADVLILAGEYQRARELYEQGVARDPRNAITHFQLGRLASRRGDFAEAIGHLRKAEQLLPISSGSFILVHAYGLAGSHADAIRLFNQAEPVAAAEPYSSSTMWALGYLGTGQNDKALERLTVTAANPRDALGGKELVFIHVNAFSDPVLDQPEFAEARKSFALTGLKEIN